MTVKQYNHLLEKLIDDKKPECQQLINEIIKIDSSIEKLDKLIKTLESKKENYKNKKYGILYDIDRLNDKYSMVECHLCKEIKLITKFAYNDKRCKACMNKHYKKEFNIDRYYEDE